MGTTTSVPARKEAEKQVQQTINTIKDAATKVYDTANKRGYAGVARSISQEFSLGEAKESAAESAVRSASFKAGYLEDAQKRGAPVGAKPISFNIESISQKIESNGRFSKGLEVYRTLLGIGNYSLAKKAATDEKLGTEFERAAERLDKLSKIVSG